MQICTSIESLSRTLADARGENVTGTGQSLVMVPTMGNLHAGHMSLIRAAVAHGGKLLVTLFVNPLQFLPEEDFDTYPRTFEDDCKWLRQEKVDYLFAPDIQEMYPLSLQCQLLPPPELADILEGEFRPGFFRGVATVVMKLFQLAQPAVAFFGKKDYQQWLVIRNMVQGLNMPVRIEACAIAREADGLAYSSRNRFLTPQQRQLAPQLNQTLHKAADAMRQASGKIPFSQIEAHAMRQLASLGFAPDYFVIRDPDTLQPPAGGRHWVLLTAARLGTVRLIDNLEMTLPD